MKSSETHMDLVSRYLSGQASFDEVETLERLMLEDPQLRADFLACARVDAALPAAIGEKMSVTEFRSESSRERRKSRWAPALAAAAMVALSVVGGFWWTGSQTSPDAAQVVARFGDLSECRWMDSAASITPGDAIARGQRIELSSGSAEVLFETGARLELIGPAIFEPRSANGGFLTMGEVNLVAETPESKGFTVETPSSTFVDISTAFTATVSPDGLSRLQVSEGEVDVILDGIEPQRLREGGTIYVEPGDRKIVTSIESGDETADFRFPTIAPPSRDDDADKFLGNATIRIAQGELQIPGSGPVDVLLDGKGQTRQDAPRQSAFFDGGRENGSFLIDLGRAIPISKVNSYSWHQHNLIEEHRNRAQQRFALYGYAGDEAPDLLPSPQKAGWTRIARVNSDRFFQVNEELDRPAQQACSIRAAKGDIGTYRYLLFHTRRSTFYGEIDVFAADDLPTEND